MSMIYVIKEACGLYVREIDRDGDALWNDFANARKFSTVGDLTAFAEQHGIEGYAVEKVEPAEVEAMAAAMHAAGEAARLNQEGATA